MRPRTPWLFLLGSRAAILDAAAHWPASLLIGALLVLSAGFARNYDGEDLRAEPWWLLGPFAASMLTSLLLFALYLTIAAAKGIKLPARWYIPFLGLYWLTAPLAWLYAIPYEMFLSPTEAVFANARTLAVVALWRVIIMARVTQVLFGCSFWAAFFIDLWFGVVVIWIASFFGPKPVLDVMGGMRISDVERAQGDLTFLTIFFGFFAVALLLIPAAIAMRKMRFPLLHTLEHRVRTAQMESSIRDRHLLATAAIALACVLAWLPLLAWQQPKQRNQRIIDEIARNESIEQVIAFASTKTAADFPAPWHPPMDKPAPDATFAQLPINQALTSIDRATLPVPGWVRRAYVDQTGAQLTHLHGWAPGGNWVERLEALPDNWLTNEPYKSSSENTYHLQWMAKQVDVLTERERAAIRRVLGEQLAPTPPPHAPADAVPAHSD